VRTVLLAVTAGLIGLAGCSPGPDKVGGDAGPAGRPAATSAPPSPGLPGAVSPEPWGSATDGPGSDQSGGTGVTGDIRRTDWANVTISNLGFLGVGDLTFRGGEATADHISCTMLPGGAKPVYAEVLAEEPANAPSTEDAVVLVECGSDAMQQALVLVQLGYDQRTRQRAGLIDADIPPTATGRMTFVAYSIDTFTVATTIRRPDGGTESRRYRHDGGDRWVRA
jgi:hypothetical protein